MHHHCPTGPLLLFVSSGLEVHVMDLSDSDYVSPALPFHAFSLYPAHEFSAGSLTHIAYGALLTSLAAQCHHLLLNESTESSAAIVGAAVSLRIDSWETFPTFFFFASELILGFCLLEEI